MLKQGDGTGRRRQPAVLQHHSDAGPQPGPRGVRVLPEEADAAVRAFLQTLRALDSGGLARAVGPQQGRDLSTFGDEGKAADHAQHFAVEGGQRPNILD